MRSRMLAGAAALLAAIATGASVAAAPITVSQVLSAPFASDLVAAPDGGRVAWISNALGRRNLWLGIPAGRGAAYAGRQLTHYAEDDGLDIGDLAFVPHGGGLLYVRGADFENPDKPAPNPAHLSAGVESLIYLVDLNGGPPVRLAEGHAPTPSPSGDRVVFLRKGEVWSVALRRDAKPARLFRARGTIDSLRFSPDGSRLAFVSTRTDHSFVGAYAFADETLRWVDASFDRDVEPRWSRMAAVSPSCASHPRPTTSRSGRTGPAHRGRSA